MTDSKDKKSSTRVANQTVRRQVVAASRAFATEPEEQLESEILKNLDDSSDFMECGRRDAEERIRCSLESSRAHLGIISISLLLAGFQEDYHPIDSEWGTKGPDPNFVMRNLLVQVTNTGLGILRLLEQGLEAPARALFRTLLESCWISSLVIFDEEYFCAYTKDLVEKDARNHWEKYFTPKKLIGRLHSVRKKFNEFNIFDSSDIRKKHAQHQYFSQAIHTSFMHAMVFAFGDPDPAGDDLTDGIFGAYSDSMTNLADNVSWALGELIFDYLVALRIVHRFVIDPDNELWDSLIFSCGSFYSSLLGIEFNKNNTVKFKENFFGVSSEVITS